MGRAIYSKIPALHLLVAFESVARHKSFSLAAKELKISPPAVTQKILQLEEIFNSKLFFRPPKSVEVTDSGKYYLKITRNGLEALRKLTPSQKKLDIYKLKMSVPPFLAQTFLLKHLHELPRTLPDINLSIITELKIADLASGEADVAIRFGNGEWNDLIALPLLPVSVTPVCSSEYLKKTSIDTLESLKHLTLLHLSGTTRGWAHFFKSNGINEMRTKRDLYFNDYASLIHACEHHAGVGLGIKPSVDQLLHEKKLVAPLPLNSDLDESYYFVFSPHHPASKTIRYLYEWVLDKLPAH